MSTFDENFDQIVNANAKTASMIGRIFLGCFVLAALAIVVAGVLSWKFL